jgi:hypothetical protein
MTVKERRSTQGAPLWGKVLFKAYWHTLHRAYQISYETPRRKALAAKVAELPPSPAVDGDVTLSVHMLICSSHVTMATCTAKAANLAFEQPLPWVFHDDGSLLDEDVEHLSTHFPGTTVVRRADADRRAAEELDAYPMIRAYRQEQVMALKLVDVRLWAAGDRIAYIDSDILFFRRPAFFIDELSKPYGKNYFNRDIASGYVQSEDDIEARVGIRPLPRANAGLWIMNAEALDLDVIEEWLSHAGFAENLFDYRLEQTFISMLARRSAAGVEHLPETYDVSFRKSVRTSVDKHYVGRIRHGFELEGLSYLLGELDFEARWNEMAAMGPSVQQTI